MDTYPADINGQAQRGRPGRIMARMRTACEGVTEELKHRDQRSWDGAMNNIRSCAEEIVRSEIICMWDDEGCPGTIGAAFRFRDR